MRVGFVALVLLALALPARADSTADDRSVGIVVLGTGPLRNKIEDHLARRLRREGYTAVDDPLAKSALDTVTNCFLLDDLTCAKGVVETRAKTPRVVIARIDDSGGSLTLAFTWFSQGRDPVDTNVSCTNCDATWRDHTDALFAELTSKAEMPIITVEPEPVPQKRSKLLPGLLIGAGAAAAITGGVMLYYGLRDSPEYKYVHPALTAPALGLIALGSGALIGGMITW